MGRFFLSVSDVVQQIAAAHGGRAVFGQNTPCGAKATVQLSDRAVNRAK